jgi:hypothetical protein
MGGVPALLRLPQLWGVDQQGSRQIYTIQQHPLLQGNVGAGRAVKHRGRRFFIITYTWRPIAMALRALARYAGGIATGVVATGAAYCDAKDDKYFDPDALERGAKVRSRPPHHRRRASGCRKSRGGLPRALHCCLTEAHSCIFF